MRIIITKSICCIVSLVALATNAFAAPANAAQAVDPKTLDAAFQAAYDVFNQYEANDAERTKNWQIMLDIAKTGSLYAKKTVADYAAGFVSLSTRDSDSERQAIFKPNPTLAMEYYREIVKRGGVESRVRLALLFSSGIGEPADESESPHNLLIGAAAKGNKEAMTLLGERYLYGHGEDKDVLEAARWEYLASVSSPRSSFWVDSQGAPLIQETPEQDEMAKVLSLFYKAGRNRDAAATAKLKTMYEAASKQFNSAEIVKAAQQPPQ